MNRDAMTAHQTVTLVPYRDDILSVAAHRVLECASALPDLTKTVVLLPDLQFAPRLRRHLLETAWGLGHAALLGPEISTIDQWLNEHTCIEQVIPGRARRELMLVEVLRQHPAVFNNGDPWQISSCLISLFDELTLNRVSIPDDLNDFTERLQAAYGIDDHLPEPLGVEANLVHRFWKAWHSQLNDEHMLDPGIASLQRLAMQQQAAPDNEIFLVGFDQLHAAQLEWIESLLQSGHAQCILYQPTHWLDESRSLPLAALLQKAPRCSTNDPRSTCLDTVFQVGRHSPAERAAAFCQQHPQSPLSGQLNIQPASSPEQEARAIDVQVRQWLLAGKQPIAIVTEDRRLARRVRALLDRAGIELQDTGGWALSTTSAAAALERWLETVEEDFAHQPLLDVLKSPFLFPGEDRDRHESIVYRLEQDIIQRENIASGLQRYRTHINLRLQRLETSWTEETAALLQRLLNRLEQAAEPLQGCLGMTRSRPVRLLQGLRASLESIGIWAAFEDDPAGQRILQEWQLLFDAASHSDIDMNWAEFRAWLGTALERHDFVPATSDSPVMLLTLQQAQLGQYEAVIIGACDREYLPASSARSPFFNDPVRSDLGLPVWSARYDEQLQRFRRLLESAPQLLLTWHQENAGEMRMPSPWLEAIRTFHVLAWQDDLAARELQALLEHPATRVAGNNPLPVPERHPYPQPGLPAALLPATLTVSMHRQLIDCPYKFFAACGLQLKPREAVKEAFEKAEYGSLVHQSLEVFHKGASGFPTASPVPVTPATRLQAIHVLEDISGAIFARELEDNFEHRAWLRRWRTLIPAYIDWQIKRQQTWTFTDAERAGEVELMPGRSLAGRLDRIDCNATGTAVLDYKTGFIPGQDEVDQGEEVQLPSYALLTDTMPQRVEYLQVDKKISNRICLESERLEELADAVKQRLVTVLGEIEAGATLPAWGDTRTCGYCEMSGLCRKQAWLENANDI
ncbi:MAG: PD-(D/E)XK nuclease family protein [Gammaproteobacteria bacterium]|nr:PD-(D/E)XK nuclease family protein [Gammaproteobacteria bacterium]